MPRSPAILTLLSLLAALAAASCQPAGLAQTAQATGDWVRSFPAPDGELQILNLNGNIEVEGTSGTVVDVRAERIAKATTDRAAQDLLTHINIGAHAADGGLTIQTERIPGVLVGASFEVTYHVKAPATAVIRTRTTNGATTITGMAGRVTVSSTNGGIVGKALSGGLDLRSVNGNATIDVSDLGDNPIDVRTINGRLQLTIPQNLNANLSATCANGKIDVTGLPFQPFGEQTPRRIRGRLNAGGTPIELNATNGDIHVAVQGEGR